jgi:hypothetical protein
MRSIIHPVLGATLGLMVLDAPAVAGETTNLVGLWKLVSFHTEDISANTRNGFFGERPSGFMQLGYDGRFAAHAVQDQLEPVQSVGEDVALSLSERTATKRTVYYSGRYSVDGSKLVVKVDHVLRDGWVDPQGFDLIWNQGRSETEEAHNYSLEVRKLDDDVLRIEGHGLGIVGRAVWQRAWEWDYGAPADLDARRVEVGSTSRY